jgi:chromosome segregation ATPase
MKRERRATDRPPLSDAVTRGNLDDRLAIVDTRIKGAERLGEERWQGHKEQHADLAASLREYKAEANEWRRTVSDLRADFLLKTEFLSEHKALESLLRGDITGLRSEHTSLDGRLDTVERAIQSINDREVTTRSVLSSGRNLVILAFTIIGGLIGVALYLHPAA